MKAHTGFFELVIIMVFIVAGVPLMMALMKTCQKSQYDYMEDKTVYKMGSVVEYNYDPITKSYVPTNLAPINLDYGAAMLLAIVQDDYCPESGKIVNWKLTANSPSGERRQPSGLYTPVDPILWGSRTNTITFRRGWNVVRNDEFVSLVNNTAAPMKSAGIDGPFYLVWDYTNDSWMITHEFVNIFEER